MSSLWGWRSTGTGCPGRWWSLLLWRYSRPAWTRSSAACCRWLCFVGRVGLDDPQRSLPTPTILWFCDSVILCNLGIINKRHPDGSAQDQAYSDYSFGTCVLHSSVLLTWGGFLTQTQHHNKFALSIIMVLSSFRQALRKSEAVRFCKKTIGPLASALNGS